MESFVFFERDKSPWSFIVEVSTKNQKLDNGNIVTDIGLFSLLHNLVEMGEDIIHRGLSCTPCVMSEVSFL